MHKSKGAPKSYFFNYWCIDIICFNTDLLKSGFSTYSFRKLVFHLSVFCVHVYSVLNSMSFSTLFYVYLAKFTVILFFI